MGLAVTALNAYAFDFFRSYADAAVNALHVMAGVGQVGAALILSLFRDLGFWWGGAAHGWGARRWDDSLSIAVVVASLD
ncbi:MAG: hypothetical protein HC837_00540 [Chloroflexaceae bacterium]|nr:hypothetical protein [Chloroflexaceae bacterium]